MAKPIMLTLLVVLALVLAPLLSSTLEASASLSQASDSEEFPYPAPFYRRFLPIVQNSPEKPYP